MGKCFLLPTKKGGKQIFWDLEAKLFTKKARRGCQSTGKVNPHRLAPSSAQSKKCCLVNRGYKHQFSGKLQG